MGEVGQVWDDPSVLRLPVPFERVYEDEDDDCARLAYVLSGSRPLAEQVTRRAFAAVRGDWQRVGRLDEPASRIRREVAQHTRPAHGRLAHLGCGHAPATKAEPDPTDGDDFWGGRAGPAQAAGPSRRHRLPGELLDPGGRRRPRGDPRHRPRPH